MLQISKLLAAIALAASIWSQPAKAHPEEVDEHPFRELSAEEIALAVELIKETANPEEHVLFHYVGLVEPPKGDRDGTSRATLTPRRAVVVLRSNAVTREAIINLDERKLESFHELPGSQPNILGSEWVLANRLIREDARWRTAMERRGLTDFNKIYCATLTVGYFGDDETRRLIRMPCYDISEGGPNLYARPIEGVDVLVDLDGQQVASVDDRQLVPVSNREYDIAVASAPSVADTDAQSSEMLRHPIFEDGRVQWQNWSFHMRIDQRVGPVLSLISFRTMGSERSILHRASLSELAVPYMSQDQSWFYRSYMDIGEYGFGVSSRLTPELDCPAGADMISAAFADDSGQPYLSRNNACIFERAPAQPLWRHGEVYNNTLAISNANELVLRTIPAVGNYDYIIDWVFTTSGEIRIEVGATGILAARGIAESEEEVADGARLTSDLVGVNHDHYFSFRLDFDIAGPANRVQIDRIVLADASDVSPRRVWKTDPAPVLIEQALSDDVGVLGWRVINAGAKDTAGKAPGYQVLNIHTATSLLPKDEWTVARSRFSSTPMWVTRYSPEELYAAGPFPNQSRANEGLAQYVDGEDVVDADVVLWPTLGFHHVPRTEEWPIMPTMTKRLIIRPFGFFAANPAVHPGVEE